MNRRIQVLVGAVVVVFSLGMQSAEATWSVVGVDAATGEVGVAVARCVGFEVTVVPVIVPGIGAAASQADISPASGQRLVESLTSGASAQAAIDDVAGATIAAFEQADGTFADRLVAGLVAGANAGGDARCGEQAATSAALIVGRPGDPPYSHTDRGVLGVDPEDVVLPSVFVSVLAEQGGDRSPDRLARAWEGSDQAGSTVVIRQIDDGADSSVAGARTAVTVVLGLVALLIVVGIAAAIWAAVRRRSP